MSAAAWIVLSVVGFVIILVVGFYLTVFLVALIEKCHIVKLVPLEDVAAPSSGKALQLDREAIENDLLFLDVFRHDDSNLHKTRLSLYLSSDGQVMLMVPNPTRTHGYRLYSRMADGVWLETAKIAGNTDLSGLRLTAMLPDCPFNLVLKYHLDRVACYAGTPVPFSPEHIGREVFEHDAARAQAAIEQGYGYWVDLRQTTWRHNLRGAIRVMGRGVLDQGLLSEGQRQAEQYKQEFEG